MLCVTVGQIVVGDDETKSKPEPAQVVTIGFVYKESPRRTLTVYYPDGWEAADKRPALVIFHCQIPEQREHFRRLGMVVVI